MLFNNIIETIGNTPIVRLGNFSEHLFGNVFAKLEMFNPGSSVKDRIALTMIEDAESKGLITPGLTTIVEPTSGNTGIGLAWVGLAKGYKTIIVMPDSANQERKDMLEGLGATLLEVPAKRGFAGAIEVAEGLVNSQPNHWSPMQARNKINPETHYRHTGPEIWKDLAGEIDIFVCGVGTGGTLSGTARYLKEKNDRIKVVAVEPEGCPLLSGGDPGPHEIQGLLAGILADTIDQSVIDDVITVEDVDAYAATERLLNVEGIFCGISSGAALHGALKVAEQEENAGKNIVTLFADSGERYLSNLLLRNRSSLLKKIA